MRFDHSGGTKSLSDTNDNGVSDNGVVVDGTNVYHIVYAHWDHNVASGTLNYMIWVNGLRAYTTVVTGSSMPASITPVNDLRFGGRRNSSGVFDGVALQLNCIQMYRSPSTVDLSLTQMDEVAKQLYQAPLSPLNSRSWPMS